MEEARGPHKEKESAIPEKPLEKDSTNGTTSNPTADNDFKKPTKASKFKSIFTRPTSQRPQENTSAASASAQSSALLGHDVLGKGDNKGTFNQGSNPQTSSDQKPVQKDTLLQLPIPVASKSANRFEQKQVSVEVHKNPSKILPIDHSEETEVILDQPNGSGSLRSRSRETKKMVKITDDSRQSNRKRIPKKFDSSTQIRSHSDQSRKHDLKSLQRRHFKMKEKTRELLLLVEELTHNCEYYKNALKDKDDRDETGTYQFLKEKESLNLQIFKLGQEIEVWKERCQRMENKNTALSKAKTLTKENKELFDDIEVLKSVICRLNKELAYYQDRLRFKFHNAPENIQVYSTSSGEEDEDFKGSYGQENAKDWLKHPRKSLLPLLIAYDEVIAEKEEIIRDHEAAIDRFKSRCLEITKENEDLHKLISANKEKGSISITEWEYLRSNAVLVLEENDLLHDQADNLKRKEEKLFSTFQEKVSAFKQTITQLEAEINRQKGTITELDGRCKNVSEDNMKMSIDLQSRVPKEKHEAMIQEFKQAFEELKTNYEADRKKLSDKLASVEKERERLVMDVTNLETENTKLKADIRDCENNLVTSTQALQQMKASILEATSARDATNGVIEDFMKHVKQLVAEKNKLLEDLNEQRLVNEQMMSMRSKENELVGELHEKIEAMERLHNEEVKAVQNRVKDLDEAMKSQKDLHRREKAQINELLREKERRIETAEAEKKQLQQDLETVWRTTTSTMTTSLKSRQT